MASVPRIVEDLQFRLATIDEKFHVLFPQTAMLDEDLVKRLTAYDMRLIEVNQELEALRTPKKTVTQLINLRRTESKLGSVSSKLDQAERDLYDLHALHSQHVSKAVLRRCCFAPSSHSPNGGEAALGCFLYLQDWSFLLIRAGMGAWCFEVNYDFLAVMSLMWMFGPFGEIPRIDSSFPHC
ncbi:hypothetical protein DL96DRAFT_1091119 [Flagelloscypha sp. PMI_526]|nr:hypothetical protein DL96DRAFT_1091119 [Flagelloscypha sp. PMI_526]